MTSTVSRPLRKLLAAGPAIYRDGNALITNAPVLPSSCPSSRRSACRGSRRGTARPSSPCSREHAGRVRYVVEEEEAVDVVAELMQAEALAFDLETVPLPLPIANSNRLHQSGRCASGSRR
jgi:hypothetical protein